jgi:hypothetical protein
MSDIVSSIRQSLLETVDIMRRRCIGGSGIETALEPCILAHTLVPSDVTREYLVDMAGLIVETGRGDLLNVVFGALGESPTDDDLVTCGQAAIERGNAKLGIALLRKAGIPIPETHLLELMQLALTENNFQRASELADAAGLPLPAEALRKVGEMHLASGNWLLGCQAYVLGNGGHCELPLDLLLACASAAAKRGDFSTLVQVYRQPQMAAARGHMFIECADAAMGHSSKLPAAFAAIDEALHRNIPGAKEKMVECAKAAIKHMHLPIAVAACERIDWAVPDDVVLYLARAELGNQRYKKADVLFRKLLDRHK